MSEPTVRGKVHLVEETKSFGQSGFRKRLVELEQDKGRFTNYIPVEFVHEACDKCSQLKVGDEVDVTYRLSGRRWQRDEHSEVKFFLSAEGVDFRVLTAGNAAGTPSSAPAEDDYDSYDDDQAPF